jgi:hypothetical protein
MVYCTLNLLSSKKDPLDTSYLGESTKLSKSNDFNEQLVTRRKRQRPELRVSDEYIFRVQFNYVVAVSIRRNFPKVRSLLHCGPVCALATSVALRQLLVRVRATLSNVSQALELHFCFRITG